MSGLSAEQERQIRELIAQDKKIAAIKLYREATSASLKDAKDAVDAIEMDVRVNFPATALVGELEPGLENRIKQLLAERKKIEAIKLYREAYRCSLKEAKDAVDAIEIGMRTGDYPSMPSIPAISNDPFAEDSQRNRSCLALVVAIIIVVIGGAVFLFLSGNGF